MKVFNISCIDNKSKMEMIVSECTFNQACSFLEGKPLGKFLGCKSTYCGNVEIKYEKRDFFYDEERGYLLGA